MPVAAFVYGHVLGPVGGPLERWLWQHGGWTNGYVTTFNDGGRGVVAAYDLRPGDRVMHVPKHLFLPLPGSWARRAWVQNESEEESQDRAQAHALSSLASRLEGEHEKMADSKWSIWVQAMMRPSNGSKAPFNSVLWPAKALPLIRALLPYYMRQVDEILKQGGSKEFLDAVRHVISRLYGGNVADGDVYLVPVADFLNHVSPRHATARARRLDGEGGLVVEAIASISAGEQIMITYGMLPNTHLLAAYGFSLPQNAMGSQVFFVEEGLDGSASHCQRMLGLEDIFENGQLHLGEALARVPEEGWGACLRQTWVRERREVPPEALPMTLGEACRARAASITAKLHDLARTRKLELGPAEEAAVLEQLEAVAGDELRSLRQCAGSTAPA